MAVFETFDFLKAWNYVVHVWIREYLYLPMIRWTSSKILAFLWSFTASYLVHDYVLFVSLGNYLFF